MKDAKHSIVVQVNVIKKTTDRKKRIEDSALSYMIIEITR